MEDQIPGKTTESMLKDHHEVDTEKDYRYFLSDDKSERNMRERVKITNRKAGVTRLASPACGNFHKRSSLSLAQLPLRKMREDL